MKGNQEIINLNYLRQPKYSFKIDALEIVLYVFDTFSKRLIVFHELYM